MFTYKDILTIYSDTVTQYLLSGYNLNPSTSNFLGGNALHNARTDLLKGRQIIRVAIMVATEYFDAKNYVFYNSAKEIPDDCYTFGWGSRIFDLNSLAVKVFEYQIPDNHKISEVLSRTYHVSDECFKLQAECKFYSMTGRNSELESSPYMQARADNFAEVQALANQYNMIKALQEIRAERKKDWIDPSQYHNPKQEDRTIECYDICQRYIFRKFGAGCYVTEVWREYSEYGTLRWQIVYCKGRSKKEYHAYLYLSHKDSHSRRTELKK